MGNVDYFFPPVYQRSPEGSWDSLGYPPAQAGDGAAVLTGEGPPQNALGSDGDVYFEQAGGSIVAYWPAKAQGRWAEAGVPLAAAQGGQLVPVIGGDGPPDERNVGPTGQIYFDRKNSIIYQAQAS